MKIILSRKGLDGGFKRAKPSPILPCGRLLSLPIPVTEKQEKEYKEDGIAYDDLRFDGQSIRKVIDPLHNYKFDYEKAHLDPDLDRDRYTRQQGWCPVFGQTGSAQGHLHNQGIGVGDLFLFFGRFRRTIYENGELHYVKPKKGGEELHVIFGWLQVGKSLEVNGDEIPDWLQYHPHIVNRNIGAYANNTIYIATNHLTLDGLSVRGGGTFPCFNPSLQLTAPRECKSHWSLPKWLQNELPGFTPLHRMNRNWECYDGYVPFDSDGRGQEFVFNIPYSLEAIEWFKTLFKNCY